MSLYQGPVTRKRLSPVCVDLKWSYMFRYLSRGIGYNWKTVWLFQFFLFQFFSFRLFSQATIQRSSSADSYQFPTSLRCVIKDEPAKHYIIQLFCLISFHCSQLIPERCIRAQGSLDISLLIVWGNSWSSGFWRSRILYVHIHNCYLPIQFIIILYNVSSYNK